MTSSWALYNLVHFCWHTFGFEFNAADWVYIRNWNFDSTYSRSNLSWWKNFRINLRAYVTSCLANKIRDFQVVSTTLLAKNEWPLITHWQNVNFNHKLEFWRRVYNRKYFVRVLRSFEDTRTLFHNNLTGALKPSDWCPLYNVSSGKTVVCSSR